MPSGGGALYQAIDGSVLTAQFRSFDAFDELPNREYLKDLRLNLGGSGPTGSIASVEVDWIRIRELTELRELRVWRTHLTSDGLWHLTTLPNLEVLWLWETSTPAEDLEGMVGFRKLKRLTIMLPDLRDEDLIHLEELQQLRILVLECRNVTAEGARKLERSLPNCKIVHYRTTR